MDIREIVRRLRAGESERKIARSLGIDRKTVGRYRRWAGEQELLKGELPNVEELQEQIRRSLPEGNPPQNVSTVEGHRELVKQLRKEGVEIAAIHQRLKERGYTGGYMAVYRFVQRLEPRTAEVVARVETQPGEEAQVDFGYVGKMLDPASGALRKTWAFVMTLSWSRYMYVEFVFDQKVETWLLCHRHALEFFGGVPERVVIDNLKAGIAKACWDEPEGQYAYRECAEHYEFLISPCRVRTPQHKGKVEQGGVHYVQRNFCGGREATTLTQANTEVREWRRTTAGERLHGTTREKPAARLPRERECLRPLPATPYDLAVWKSVKVHRDGHVVFENAYYSAPFKQVGRTLWVRGGAQSVRLYTQDYQLIATHDRAQQPGQRLTHPDHLPEYKLAGVVLTRENCRTRAETIGPETLKVVERLLEHRPEDRLRTAGRILRLAQTFTPARLEAACAGAWRFDDTRYVTLKNILQQGLDQQALPEPPAPPPPAKIFARPVLELLGHLLGGGLCH